MEMFTLTTAKELQARGHVICIAAPDGSRLLEESGKAGMTAVSFPKAKYVDPVGVSRFMKLLRKEQFDIIHSSYSKDLWLLVPALKLLRLDTPLFLTKQVGSYIVKKDFLHRVLYRRVTKALAISTIIKNNLLDTCPLEPDQIEMLYNAVDTKRFDPDKIDRASVRSELGLREDELVIGMTARFSPGKGHEEFLEAAAMLNGKYENLRFMIVGEPSRGEDAYGASVKRLAEGLQLKNVLFTGYRSDIPEMMAAMDVFVFPSHSEAFGIALVEALSMRKATVAANADGVLDIMVDGQTGLLFQVKSVKDLAQKISQMIDNPGTRADYGNAARERVKEVFDLPIIMERLIMLYQSVL